MTKPTTTFAVDGTAPSPSPPDPEVTAKAQRRTFTTAYKLGILEELDRCGKPGEAGAVLRREGLYSSSLVAWRRQRKQGTLNALAPVRRGPPAVVKSDDAGELARLRRENARLERQLAKATLIIGIQKKAAQILEIEMTEIAAEI
jgi:transposase-like protein